MRKLPDILLASKLVTPAQLEEALASQSLYGGSLDTNLMELTSLEEGDLQPLLEAAAGQRNRVDRFATPAPAALRLLDGPRAERFRAVPMVLAGQTLEVLVVDPDALAQLDELAFVTGCRLQLSVATEARVHWHIERSYGVAMPVRLAPLVSVKRLPGVADEGASPAPTVVVERSSRPSGEYSVVRRTSRSSAPPFMDLPEGEQPVLVPLDAMREPILGDRPARQSQPPSRQSQPPARQTLTPMSSNPARPERQALPPPLPSRPSSNHAQPEQQTLPTSVPARPERPALPALELDLPERPTMRAEELLSEELRAELRAEEARREPRPTPSRTLPPPASLVPPRVVRGSEPPEPPALSRPSLPPLTLPPLLPEVRARPVNPAMSATRPPPHLLDAAFADVQDLDGLAQALLDLLEPRFARLVLFSLNETSLRGWDARGGRLRREVVAALSFDRLRPSVLGSVAMHGLPYLGSLPFGEIEEALLVRIGGEWPTQVALWPICLRGRSVYLVYGEAEGAEGLRRARALLEEVTGRAEQILLKL